MLRYSLSRHGSITAVTVVVALSSSTLAIGEEGQDMPPDPSPLFLDFSVEPAVPLEPMGTKADDGDIEWKPLEDGTGDRVDILSDEPGHACSECGRAAATLDVGIIPEKPGECPSGSEYIEIHTDDEDEQNNSFTSGWTGAIRREGSGTTFGFCRVDGAQLAPVPGISYAVLSLGSSCPAGSHTGTHHFDNENENTDNWSTGDILPSTCPLPGSWYDGANCWVATPPAGTTPFAWNGALYYTAVSVPSCPVAGSAWDSNACYIQTPSGSTPFAWNGDLYYTAQPGPSCSVAGSAWDGNACWINVPAGSTPFVWNGDLYYTAVMTPTCPLPGSAWDGNACFVKSVPLGTTPFVYQGHLYYTAVCHP